MFFVYILQSETDKVRYVGVTGKNPIQRTEEHNSNKSRFTRSHQPWKLIYTEEYSDKHEAFQRERFLKSGQGRKWLDQHLKL